MSAPIDGLSRVCTALAATGLPLIGGWSHLPGGFVAEVLGTADFDWCCVDRQHGLIDEADMFDMVRVLDLCGTPPVVRVSNSDTYEIGRALDAGAHGVIVPVVRGVADAQRAADACRFAPEGTRSWATTRSKLHSQKLEANVANQRVACIVMIETVEALEALEEIAGLPDVDGLFFGAGDLGLVLAGEGASVDDAAKSVVDCCSRHRKIAGVFAGGSDRVPEWLRQGFELVAVEADSMLLMQAARAAVESARAAAERRQSPVVLPPRSVTEGTK